MKKALVLSFVMLLMTVLGCSSDDNCTKTITIPARTIVSPTGSAYYPEYTQEVRCDYVVTPIQEQTALENFTYEVLNFTFTPNTGNNTNRLKFDIKLNNQNNFTVKGFSYLTVNVDGIVSSGGFINGASSICNEINANSSCFFSYDSETSLDFGLIESIQLVDLKYYLN